MENEISFTKSDFIAICDCCRSGNLRNLQNLPSIISNSHEKSNKDYPLSPDPKLHMPSPLVLAAQYGHLSIVTYLVDKLGGRIDINKGATIVSNTTRKNVHHATALWAACTGGFLEVVQYLISKGADVNKTTLTRSTPLRGASFHGYINIMKYLLENGANINTPNCIGQSPLCIAAMRGEVEAVQFLLDQGADRDQCTINGYSVMHLAAAKGKYDVVKTLLEYGVSPQFQEADPFCQGYVPCPLFLAASTGQNKAVEVLMEDSRCPLSCKADANLLLAAMQCELRKRLRTTETKIQEYWNKGLRIRQDNNLPLVRLPRIEEYCFQEEIADVEELNAVWYTPNFSHWNVFYQSLLIRERCMGFLDQGLIYFLIRRGSYFCQDGRCREAELLWKRAMEMEVLVCEVEVRHEQYGHCEGIMRDLEKDLGVYANGVRTMLEGGFEPDFPMYLNYGMKELEILESLEGKADLEIVSNETIIGLMLELFLSWILHCKTKNQSKDQSQKYEWSDECHEIGCRFVSKYLHFKPGTTLLHHSLTNFSLADGDDKHILDHFTDLCPLVTALIAWGAEQVIDWPDGCGSRPVHVALSLDDENNEDHEVLSPLINGGAHLDAVDKNGRSVYSVCRKTVHRTVLYSVGPPSLCCLAARTVVSEDVPYQSLPRYVQNFIQYHDSRCIVLTTC